ncbi:MAG TPA: hypothetical protein VE987_06615 [Polyangiaceae bacterium]|nr:hypothetical protein [Polyangiaceae bacterium]
MSQIDRQLWRERIARALAELKKDALAEDRPPAGNARDPRHEPAQHK